MKLFFDTSVLNSAHLVWHEMHEASLQSYVEAEGREAFCAGSTLAEMYSTLTRIAGPRRLSSDDVLGAIAEVRERMTIVTLDARELVAGIEWGAAQGILGGTIHDALIARCALKAGADVIYTWNVRHFNLLGPEVAALVRTP